MLERCARAGVPPHVSAHYTFREVNYLLRAHRHTVIERLKENTAIAWQTAMFVRAKKLPRLESALRKIDPRPTKPMSINAIRSTIIGMHSAMGGRTVTLDSDEFRRRKNGPAGK